MVDNFRDALTEVRDIGKHFYKAAGNFLDNPVNKDLYEELLKASRSFLSSVIRVLILADLVDLNQLHSCLGKIKSDAECLGIVIEKNV